MQHVIDAAIRSNVEEVVVVLGASLQEVLAAVSIPDHVNVVVNEHFEKGHATSLKAGLEATSGSAAIVVLGDEPEVREEAIDLVAARWRRERSPVIRCVYDGSPGHPVLLAREIWNDLPPDGDEGARRLIEARPDLVDDISVPGRRPIDVDTRADYTELRR